MSKPVISDTSIAQSAGNVAHLYWNLADELRAAAVALSTAVGAGSELPVVGTARLAQAMTAGMALKRMAGDTR
jgi:hypothetical protein